MREGINMWRTWIPDVPPPPNPPNAGGAAPELEVFPKLNAMAPLPNDDSYCRDLEGEYMMSEGWSMYQGNEITLVRSSVACGLEEVVGIPHMASW